MKWVEIQHTNYKSLFFADKFKLNQLSFSENGRFKFCKIFLLISEQNFIGPSLVQTFSGMFLADY